MPRYFYYILMSVLVILFFNYLTTNCDNSEQRVASKSYHSLLRSKEEVSILDSPERQTFKKTQNIQEEIARDTIKRDTTDSSLLFVSKDAPIFQNQKDSISKDTKVKKNKQEINTFFEQLIKDYIPTKIRKGKSGSFRSDITVRYYKYKADGDKVSKLRYHHYYIHKKEVLDDDGVQTSNFITYGKNISKEDLQIIAFVLISNGMPIKAIVPSKYGNSWKANSVEIGMNKALINKENISLEQILNLKI